MSALVGAGVVLLAGVLSAQHVANRFVSVRVLETPTLEVAPHPRDYVRFVEGTPYSVPPGKILVVTGLHVQQYYPSEGGTSRWVSSLLIDGVVVFEEFHYPGLPSSGLPTVAAPRGLTATQGQVVSVAHSLKYSQSPTLAAIGYLVDD